LIPVNHQIIIAIYDIQVYRTEDDTYTYIDKANMLFSLTLKKSWWPLLQLIAVIVLMDNQQTIVQVTHSFIVPSTLLPINHNNINSHRKGRQQSTSSSSSCTLQTTISRKTTTATTGNSIVVPVPSHSTQTRKATTTTTTSSSLRMSLFSNWDDIMYQTESLGNSLASFSLLSSNSNMITAFPIMYGAGLLTSFSPCVWGLLPLTISYISTAANERTDQQTILPTIAFAAGLATVFCSMGMIAVSIGSVFGSVTAITSSFSSTSDYNNNAVAYTGIILPIVSNFVCFIMGLKLLDLIDIPLPSFDFLNPTKLFPSTNNNNNNDGTMSQSTTTTTRTGPILLDATGRQVGISTLMTTTTSTSTSTAAATVNDDNDQKQNESNSLFRTFLLGGSSAVVASPCATPVLTSILAFVANTAESTSSSFVSTMIGAFLLFGYTLGYSTPLLIVAATSGQALVRLKQKQQQQQPGSKLHEEEEEKTEYTSNRKGVMWLSNIPNMIAPWVTPITGGILLYLGTTGILVNIIGDPSLSGLTILE
jgi:cytochrome c biogenesis protein CcdA